MKIAILGGGPIGLTYAALLRQNGHQVVIYSQSANADATPLTIEGAVEFSGQFDYAADLEGATAGADILLCTRRAVGVQNLIDNLAPLVQVNQTLIFSADLSLSAHYAAMVLGTLGKQNAIISWSTTVATAQRRGPTHIVSGTLRDRIDYAVANPTGPDGSGMLLEALFGARFHRLTSVLAVALSNLNPPIHLANALANLTRIEKGEDWDNYAGITPAVGRMIEALDKERITLAGQFGLKVRDVFEHYLQTFPNLAPGSVSEMAARVSAKGPGTPGPKLINTRYLTEDIPFGLVPLVRLGELAGVAMPLHDAGIKFASAYTGQDFASQNTMLPELLAHCSLEKLTAL
tara:strand:- start:8916 stop:9956 length:1041 start_codon:yes stop_codon:yes gene_type:complete